MLFFLPIMLFSNSTKNYAHLGTYYAQNYAQKNI